MGKKIDLELSDKACEQLESLMEDTGFPTMGEVLRDSISLQMFINEQKKKGYEIVIKDPKSKKEWELIRKIEVGDKNG